MDSVCCCDCCRWFGCSVTGDNFSSTRSSSSKMAYSTLNIGCTEQTTIAGFWKIDVSPDESSMLSPNINYICVPIDDEVKKNIISTHEALPVQDGASVLIQFWAAIDIGNICVLTTTSQPFGLFGYNQELEAYRKGCLDHKLYVYKDAEKEVAFGLPGRVFLNCAPVQTHNLHEHHPTDQRPPCEDAIFTRIWGSFAMPVIHANKRVGVLEFVMDTPKDCYNNDILAVYKALQRAGLQSSVQFDRPRRTSIDGRERFRKTKSFSLTKYCCLVPYFGLSSACAAEKLGLKPGAFRDLCRNVGIPVWPWIRNTTSRAFFGPVTQMNQAISETSSFVTHIADSISISDGEFPRLSWEQPMSTIPSVHDTGTNQIAFETTDIEAWIKSERALPGFMPDCGEMINQHSNAPIMEDLDFMDVEEHINIDYPNANMIIQDEGFPEWPWQEIYVAAILSAQQTETIQNAFEISGDPQAWIEFASFNEDLDPMDIFDFNLDNLDN
ncbi:hypothetical protein R6Q57_012547 [Mikania cordata]